MALGQGLHPEPVQWGYCYEFGRGIGRERGGRGAFVTAALPCEVLSPSTHMLPRSLDMTWSADESGRMSVV